jgi:hypothetical protein
MTTINNNGNDIEILNLVTFSLNSFGIILFNPTPAEYSQPKKTTIIRKEIKNDSKTSTSPDFILPIRSN